MLQLKLAILAIWFPDSFIAFAMVPVTLQFPEFVLYLSLDWICLWCVRLSSKTSVPEFSGTCVHLNSWFSTCLCNWWQNYSLLKYYRLSPAGWFSLKYDLCCVVIGLFGTNLVCADLLTILWLEVLIICHWDNVCHMLLDLLPSVFLSTLLM